MTVKTKRCFWPTDGDPARPSPADAVVRSDNRRERPVGHGWLRLAACGWVMIVSSWLVTGAATAQAPHTAWHKTGVDSLILVDGTRLFGLIDLETRPPAWAFVDRAWLKSRHPQRYQDWSQRESTWWTRRKPELLTEIDAWIDRRSDNRLLVSFLEDERRRIDQLDATQLDQTPFLAVPLDEIKRYQPRSPEQRRIAALAWQHGIDNVVTTSVQDLQKQLEAAGVDVKQTPVNLVPCLPPMPESDDAWSARVALVEYQYHEPLEFHGTRTSLWPADSQPRPEMLLSALGADQANQLSRLGRALGLPEFRQTKPPADDRPANDQQAIEAAPSRGLNGVLVTRLWEQTAQHVVTRTVFHARLADDRFFPLYQRKLRFPLSAVTPAQIEGLGQNEQVQQALQTVRNLGLPIDPSQLELALRHGAATQTALVESRDAFGVFLQPHVERLDTFPVRLK